MSFTSPEAAPISISTVTPGKGRAIALTVGGRKELFRGIAAGASLDNSARVARIAPATLYRYMALGKAEQDEASALDEFATAPPDSWWALLEDIKAAQALFTVERLERIRAGEPGWQGSAWLLERKWPERWGRSTKIEVGGTGGGPVKVERGVVVLPMPATDDDSSEPTP